MISAIAKEISLRKNYIPKQINSLYFGGGTPSLLNIDELTLLVDEVKKNFDFSEDFEFTLECNPDDINEEKLIFWKQIGVNRLSIGVQSFQDADLIWMNRPHNVNDAIKSIKLAQQFGFDNITIDLIYGLPNLSNEQWISHLQKAIDLNVQHISAYCLTVEEGTLLGHQVQKGKITPANEDQQSEQFQLLVDILEKNGFEQYEISNFAKNQKYAVHNTSYWLGKPYLGIGPSAHSFNGDERRWNVSNNSKYYQSVGENENWFEKEILSPANRFNELLLTGLRTKFGVNLKQLEQICIPAKSFHIQLNSFIELGLVLKKLDIIQLSPKGKLQADKIALDLFMN